MANEDNACMAAPDTERSDREESKRKEALMRKEEEILNKMGYMHNHDVNAWWSDDLDQLPLLKDSEARALADEIINFVIR